MPSIERRATGLNVARYLYLFLSGLSFYLLFASRSGEIRTVWDFMSPLFLPAFFATTLLLLILLLSTEKTVYKLAFVMIHSFLAHSLFIIVFPAGDLGVQQEILGRTRLTFDDVILHGWAPGPITSIVERMYHWSRSLNFQAALSVILARMLSIDVYWIHLPLAPILWSVFVPIATFKTTKELGADDRVSVLSSLLILLFPWAIYGGTASVPNSIGYVFFAFSVFLTLRYLTTGEPKLVFLVVAFSFATLLAHHLAGVATVSLLLLAIALRSYQTEKERSLAASRLSVLMAFVLSMLLLPFALVYLKVFYPIYTYFDLSKLRELTPFEFIWTFIFGDSVQIELSTVLIFVASSLAGLAGVVYVWMKIIRKKSDKYSRLVATFLVVAFVLFLAQYRILKFFMVNVPFAEGRLWMFRDFVGIPLLAILIGDVSAFLLERVLKALNSFKASLTAFSPSRPSRRTAWSCIVAVVLLVAYASIPLVISSWTTISLLRAYPPYGPLQTTTYEIEAVKFIDQSTDERYVVISDWWIILAAQMFVGVHNPRAYYFDSREAQGVSLYTKMKQSPTSETMLEAMQQNNSSVAYYVIEQPRIGSEAFDDIVSRAIENNLQVYKTFGDGKLYIFRYEKSST